MTATNPMTEKALRALLRDRINFHTNNRLDKNIVENTINGAFSAIRESGYAVVEKERLEMLPDLVAVELRHHVNEMYPEVVKSAPTTFVLSIVNVAHRKAQSLCEAMVTAAELAGKE